MPIQSGDMTELDPRPRSAGRPRSAEVDAGILTATRSLLIEVGFDRLSMELVAARAGTARTSIYRRWQNKTDLVIAAIERDLTAPTEPDTGSLREDLLACARYYQQKQPETHQLLAALLTETLRNRDLREAAQHALGMPYEAVFLAVLTRARDRGELLGGADLELIAAVFPVFAFHRVAVEGRPVDDDLIVRIIDGCVLPLAIGVDAQQR